ncbi:hypothetical protein [Hyphomicrobium sp. MC1]|uniref:hypothetical protein n=1 Tax=Hyphomicrobium sp. (strain MC1) TaxID=717785 RepID=UPI000213DA8E|nr:hypothetical protein [Hyphomicrobium sp. MC1]CCB64435.1 conserved protein of unknown function [Hyphomicrobium sp. MC1]
MTLQKHEYGNWKPKKADKLKAKLRDKHDDRDGNSSHHLAALRLCPCVISLRTPAGEAHHIKAHTGERGVGMRSSDRWALPITRVYHDSVERVGSRNEMRWFAENGISEPHELAAALWAVRPTDGSAKAMKMAVTAMTKIIIANHKKLER